MVSLAGKVLVTGGSFGNKGAEAMLRTVQAEFSKRVPGIQFAVSCLSAKAEFYRTRGFVPLTPGPAPRWRKAWTMAAVLFRRLTGIGVPLGSIPLVWGTLAEFDTVDAVLDISGFAFGDQCDVNDMRYILRRCQAFRLLGKPVIFLPQAWGPFSNPRVKRLAAKLIQCATFTYARDVRSYDFLRELDQYSGDRAALASDIAFLFNGLPPKCGARVLQETGVPIHRGPMVGISPNTRIIGYMGSERYVELLASAASHLGDDLGCSVVLIPHDLWRNEMGHDDRYVCRMVLDRLGRQDHTYALIGDYSAETLKSVIGLLDLLVGSRFHAIVAALSQGVPAVVVGWSHKYTELMSAFGLAQYALDHHEANRPSLTRMLDLAWAERERTRDRILDRLPAVRRACSDALDHVAEILLRGRG